MPARVTRKEVEAVFAHFCASIGRPIGGKFDPATRTMSRGLSLDYVAPYGGYVIHEHSGEDTGVSCPFGYDRWPAREFVARLHFARAVLRDVASRS